MSPLEEFCRLSACRLQINNREPPLQTGDKEFERCGHLPGREDLMPHSRHVV